jgi:DNA replication protein DnaC
MMDGRQLPSWHAGRTLADLSDEGPYAQCARALELARTWTRMYMAGEQPRKGLLLHGPNGTGKTSILAALACTLGVPDGASYYDVRNLFAAAKAEMGGYVRETVIDQAVRRRVAVVDDVGKQRGTEWAVETIRDLIERRFDRPGYTHVATNLDPPELATLLGPAAWSRVQAMCAFVPVIGADLRLTA